MLINTQPYKPLHQVGQVISHPYLVIDSNHTIVLFIRTNILWENVG